LNLDDVEKMDNGSIIRHRFEVVLFVRYHNLRILVHRRCLESLLDPIQTQGDTMATSEMRLLQQMGMSSVMSCVESAISIISIVHDMSAGSGWRRELLGAWNYSLYYSRWSPVTFDFKETEADATQPSMQHLLYLAPSLWHRRSVTAIRQPGSWLAILGLILTRQLKHCVSLTRETLLLSGVKNTFRSYLQYWILSVSYPSHMQTALPSHPCLSKAGPVHASAIVSKPTNSSHLHDAQFRKSHILIIGLLSTFLPNFQPGSFLFTAPTWYRPWTLANS
jgi:hypothetical protein